MPNVRRDDYDKIVEIFNDSGIKAAMEYIELNFGVKYPRDVLTRIKKSDGYSYDTASKKIIKKTSFEDESIFIGIDQLCKQVIPEKLSNPAVLPIGGSKDFSIELLYQDLMQEKLLELVRYVRLNRSSNMVSINKTALMADGYQVSVY